MPAFTRSRIMSRSNSANTDSSPIIARPAEVVKSRASVSETNAVPRSRSSASEAIRSGRDRPQRSSFQTTMASTSRLPSYQTFVLRLNRLEPTFQTFGAVLARALAARQTPELDHLVDSLPVMLARHGHSYGARVARDIADI